MAAKGSDVFACHGHGKIRLDFVFTRAAGVGKTVLAYIALLLHIVTAG